MDKTIVQSAAREAGIDLFDFDGCYSGSLDSVAERLTAGRTHYFDSSTRRFHKSRVVKLSALDHGLILGFVESVALDHQNTRRGYRPGFIRADGVVFDRPGLDESHKTKNAALRQFWELANAIDGAAVFAAMLTDRAKDALRTLQGIESARGILARGVSA